jgi:hemerythrin superfamily protein
MEKLVTDRPPTTLSTTDIVQLLLVDHRQAEELLARFDGLRPEDRAPYFGQVVTELVRHEVAEEHVVYPIIRRGTPGGEAEANARIAEESQAEALLAGMEKLDATSAEFATKFVALRQAVLAHASSEESTTFPLLAELEDAESRVALGGRYEHAKSVAPTHPHPHAPHSPPGNLVLDPVAAPFDRARNAVKGA